MNGLENVKYTKDDGGLNLNPLVGTQGEPGFATPRFSISPRVARRTAVALGRRLPAERVACLE